MKISSIMYEGIDLFKKYNLDQYLNCLCLSVSRKYRGLNIGQRLMEAMCVLFFRAIKTNEIAETMKMNDVLSNFLGNLSAKRSTYRW